MKRDGHIWLLLLAGFGVSFTYYVRNSLEGPLAQMAKSPTERIASMIPLLIGLICAAYLLMKDKLSFRGFLESVGK